MPDLHNIGFIYYLCITNQFLPDEVDYNIDEGSFITHLPQNKNMAEDIEILLSVKFCCIPFSGFRGEVENV